MHGDRSREPYAVRRRSFSIRCPRVSGFGGLLIFFLTSSALGQSNSVAALNSQKPIRSVSLSYTVTKSNLLSKADFEKRFERLFGDVRRQMEAIGRSKDEIETAELEMRDQQTAKKTSKIEYSYDANHFCYAEVPSEGFANDESKGRLIVYYNGKYTLILRERALYISEGRNFRLMEFLPMFGVQLFDIPLVVERADAVGSATESPCGVFIRQYLDNKNLAIYVPGSCRIQAGVGVPRLREATIGMKGSLLKRYAFDDYATSDGITLAKHGVHEDFFERTLNGKPANIPSVRTDYRLDRWSAKYSGFTAKDLQALLRVNDPVLFEQDQRIVKRMDFSFKDPELAKYFEEGPESNLLNWVVLRVTASAGVRSGAVAIRSIRKRAHKT